MEPCSCSHRPEWAHALPDRRDLDYVRSLLSAGLYALVALWLVYVVLRDPHALLRIGRRQVGE